MDCSRLFLRGSTHLRLCSISIATQFNDNKPHGKGKLVFPDGSTYEGGKSDGAELQLCLRISKKVHQTTLQPLEFQMDKRHGRGTFVSKRPNVVGFTYEGQWEVGCEALFERRRNLQVFAFLKFFI